MGVTVVPWIGPQGHSLTRGEVLRNYVGNSIMDCTNYLNRNINTLINSKNTSSEDDRSVLTTVPTCVYGERKVFTCSCASMLFADHVSWVRHSEQAHQREKRLYKCSNCRQGKVSYLSVAAHYGKCRKTEALAAILLTGNMKCEFCSKCFSTRSGVSAHERQAHRTEFSDKQRAQPSSSSINMRSDAPSSGDLSDGNRVLLSPSLVPVNRDTHAGQANIAGEDRPYRTRGLRDVLDQNDTPNYYLQGAVQDTNISSELRNVIRACCDDTPDKIAGHLTRFVSELAKEPSARGQGVCFRGKAGSKKTVRSSVKQAKVSRYVSYQKMFVKSKSTVADWLWTGCEPGAGVEPPMDDLVKVFGDVMSSESCHDNEPFIAKERIEVMQRISEDEVRTALRGAKNSAPGYDKLSLLTLKQLAKTSTSTVAALCNMVLAANGTFDKVTRTTMIPKGGDSLMADNWRPIAVSSHLTRLTHKILAGRLLKKVSMNSRQKAFIKEDGILGNVAILDALLRDAKRRHKSLCLMTIDVSKAFPSVSHNSIIRASQRSGCDGAFTQYLTSVYSDSATVLHCGSNISKSIPVRRGVRQGDPLSPILFNLVLDELLDKLNAHSGYSFYGENVSCLAFADDLVLVSENEVQMQKMLDDTCSFLGKKGMQINMGKCHAIWHRCNAQRVSFFETSETWRANEQGIHMLDSGDHLRYLGVKFGPKGVFALETKSLDESLRRLRRAPLKPQQKLSLIRSYLIPRLFHGLVLGKTDIKCLQKFDLAIRRAVLCTLKLPVDFPKSAMAAALKDGGLGIPCLVSDIPATAICRYANLKKVSGDPVLAAVVGSRYFLERERRWIRCSPIKAERSVDGPSLGKADRNRQIKASAKKDLHKRCDGDGLIEAADHHGSRNWILNPPSYMQGRTYLSGIHWRYLAIRCKARSGRGRAVSKLCRAGCGMVETPLHISQLCKCVHGLRISRHNRLVELISESAKAAGVRVVVEPRIATSEGLRKPDLILVNLSTKRVAVVDVQVAWRRLRSSHASKVAKYEKHVEISRVCTNLCEGAVVKFGAVIVSPRGLWCKDNDTSLEHVGLATLGLMNVCLASVFDSNRSVRQAFSKCWNLC